MTNGRRDVSKELAYDDYFAYGKMTRAANSAGWYLQASWERVSDRNSHLERMALWHTILLANECAEALEPGHALRLWPPGVAIETRYGLQAGIRMVHATVPFSRSERLALSGGPFQRFAESPLTGVEATELVEHEPELVEHWHEWLWLDELGRPQQTAQHLGASAMLAESCLRLKASIDTIRADPMAEPL